MNERHQQHHAALKVGWRPRMVVATGEKIYRKTLNKDSKTGIVILTYYPASKVMKLRRPSQSEKLSLSADSWDTANALTSLIESGKNPTQPLGVSSPMPNPKPDSGESQSVGKRKAERDWFTAFTVATLIVVSATIWVGVSYMEMRSFNKFSERKATMADALFSKLRILSK